MGFTAQALFFYSLALWGVPTLALLAEGFLHDRNRERIGLRIHVNGTRGKSGVTRLIAAGLGAGGMRVLAKTTGTAPRIILPDGREEAIRRRGPANIRENLAVFRRAVRECVDAVVIECMAIRPDLQWTLEHRIIRAHIGVITNVRPDHEDVMGEGPEAVARALAHTIPASGVLVTTPGTADLLRNAGAPLPDGRLRLVSGLPEPRDLSGFTHQVFPENVALALAVCIEAGVAPDVALAGMRNAAPDAGNSRVRTFWMAGKRVPFADALAANDPESTLRLWHGFKPATVETIVLLNARADRRHRTVQLCGALVGVHDGPLLVTGDAAFAARVLRKRGAGRVTRADREECPAALEALVAESRADTVRVFAAGNTRGMERLMAYLETLRGGDARGAAEGGPDTAEDGPDTAEDGPDTAEDGPDTVDGGSDTAGSGPDTVEGAS